MFECGIHLLCGDLVESWEISCSPDKCLTLCAWLLFFLIIVVKTYVSR